MRKGHCPEQISFDISKAAVAGLHSLICTGVLVRNSGYKPVKAIDERGSWIVSSGSLERKH